MVGYHTARWRENALKEQKSWVFLILGLWVGCVAVWCAF
jgi:hypothetical protein